MNKLNPENKCAQLYNQDIQKLKSSLSEIFEMQKKLQKFYGKDRGGIDFDKSSFKERVDYITLHWRNLSLEFAELMERLPFKEWKKYSNEELSGFLNEEHKLEVWYEYCDMLHFFINIGLSLGINGDVLEKLYLTKNKENFDRQNRGY